MKSLCVLTLTTAAFVLCEGRRMAFVPTVVVGVAPRRAAAIPVAAYVASAPAANNLSYLPTPLPSAGAENERTVEEELHLRREDLKRRLLASADEYKQVQEAMDRAARREADANNTEHEQEVEGKIAAKKGGYVARLLTRIVAKILRRNDDRNAVRERRDRKTRSLLGSEAFGTLTLEVGELGNATIALAERLSELNPTTVPTYGWKGYGGGDPIYGDCKLDGRWKLRFTTAADATFPESLARGRAITSQEVDPVAGTLTNVVDFERGKVEGFRVVVAGEAASDDEIELSFRRVVIRRRSRFPRLLGRIAIPIPARLLRAVNRFLSGGKSGKRGPYFQLKYLDKNLRMHKTGEGNWFIQSRLEE